MVARDPSPPVAAVDIGGSKLAVAVVDADGGVVRRGRVPTPDTDDPETVWAALDGLLHEVVVDPPTAVGVGCGGPMRWPDGVVSPLNIPAWRDFPLRERLRDRFPGAEVRVHNDAVAVAVAEHWIGAGMGARGVLGMVVSTGVGGGLVLDGRLVHGGSGNAGHIGHVVVDPRGPECACGGRGCLEAIARGPAVLQWAADHGWRAGTHPPHGSDLVAAARGGDAVALTALARAGEAIGVALASVVHLLDLDVVAIGGGLANAGDLLLGPARTAFARHAGLGYATRCRIAPAELGADAGLVGAAAFVLRGDDYWPA